MAYKTASTFGQTSPTCTVEGCGYYELHRMKPNVVYDTLYFLLIDQNMKNFKNLGKSETVDMNPIDSFSRFPKPPLRGEGFIR